MGIFCLKCNTLRYLSSCAYVKHSWKTLLPSRLTGPADSLARQTHLPGRLTGPADSLARQTHLPGRLTCSADSLARQTHWPGRLTCPADSLAWQTHLPGRLTCLADSLAWQTHLPGRLICPADLFARQSHLLEATADDTSLYTQVHYWNGQCREACGHSWSGGHQFESPRRTRGGKTLEVRSFYTLFISQ